MFFFVCGFKYCSCLPSELEIRYIFQPKRIAEDQIIPIIILHLCFWWSFYGLETMIHHWMVVSNLFFSSLFGEDEPISTRIFFQMGWFFPPTRSAYDQHENPWKSINQVDLPTGWSCLVVMDVPGPMGPGSPMGSERYYSIDLTWRVDLYGFKVGKYTVRPIPWIQDGL